MEQFLQVGIISSTHGVHGEVNVYPTTDDVKRFSNLKQVMLDTGSEQLFLDIQQVKYFKQFAILKFKGIDTVEDVEIYKGMPLFVQREDAVPLQEDEYYIGDLIGMEVETDTGEIGKLTDIMETGANEVYVVDFEKWGEVLIPAIKDCILKVDVAENKMNVHLLKGLVS